LVLHVTTIQADRIPDCLIAAVLVPPSAHNYHNGIREALQAVAW